MWIVKYIAWDTDSDRDHARPYTDAVGSLSVAQRHARRLFERGKISKYVDVTVLDVDANEQHEFTVDVEHVPTFTARMRG